MKHYTKKFDEKSLYNTMNVQGWKQSNFEGKSSGIDQDLMNKFHDTQTTFLMNKTITMSPRNVELE